MTNDKIIVALDTSERKELDFLISELTGTASFLKVGMELYYSFGPKIINELKEKGFKIFLDLKMHDIPTTVARAAKALAKLDVDMLNLHAAGGSEMMKQASHAFKEYNKNGILIAVTHLTSTSPEVLKNEIKIELTMDEAILAYAKLSKENGIDGVVCSPLEVKKIKQTLGSNFLCVTPGVRPIGSESHDQVRIKTPMEAINLGSDYLVIGRPITKANSPKQAFQKILEELSK